MKANIRFLLPAVLVLAGWFNAAAAESTVTGTSDPAAIQARRAAVAKENGEITALRKQGETKSSLLRAASKAAGSAEAPSSTPQTKAVFRPNSYRAYAPSCVADPLPTQFSGPLYPPNGAFRVRLAAGLANSPNFDYEDVNIRIWRVPCSSSGEFFDSVTLMAIDRDAANEGRTDRYPLFPAIRITQGSNSLKRARVADEPNTVLSNIAIDEPLVNSGTYVLENFPSNDTSVAFFDYNNPFTIVFYNLFQGDQGQPMNVAVYNPSQSTYPTAYQNQPISGYLTGNWYDPTHDGEGMLVQVFNVPGDATRVLLTFAWFTYTPTGAPFWLFGGTTVTNDSRGPFQVPTTYSVNGTFAGNGLNPTGQTRNWGSVTLAFPTCYKMTLTYNGDASAVGGPTGSGTRTTWTKPIDVNALNCE